MPVSVTAPGGIICVKSVSVTAVLGIDLGTSQVKALTCAPDGQALGQGSAGYDIAAPRDGWAESDPASWWRAVRTAVRAAAPAEVAAIAVTGQMHGLVLCTERAVVLRPAILWLDRRATAEMADYRRLPEQLREVLGNPPAPGIAGPLALWLSRHEPAAYRRARWQLQPKDWLRFRLTGEAAADPSDASATLLYDLPRDAWAVDVAEALGLRTDFLPPLRGSAQAAGELLPEAAGELGLPPGIPVATGCSDNAASLLAADLPGDGWALLTLGTGGQWMAPASASAQPDPAGRTNLFRAVEGSYRLAGAQNIGVTLDWVRRALNATWDELYAAAGPQRGRGPVFDPRLVSERWDAPDPPAAPPGGGWTGLTLAHGRDDLLHAALLGVAGVLSDRLADLRAAGCAPRRVLVGGGGARNAAWRELLSGVLGLPLVPAGTPWLTVRGATLLAQRMLTRG